MRFVPFMRASLSARSVVLILAVSLFAQPAAAGMEDAVKALQSGDVVAAEKELQALAKERDPRAQFFLGLYIYGNPDSKLFDLTKGAPLLLDAAERGYTPAMIPLAGAYAEGKGVPKSMYDSYKWVVIADSLTAGKGFVTTNAANIPAVAPGQGVTPTGNLTDTTIALQFVEFGLDLTGLNLLNYVDRHTSRAVVALSACRSFDYVHERRLVRPKIKALEDETDLSALHRDVLFGIFGDSSGRRRAVADK